MGLHSLDFIKCSYAYKRILAVIANDHIVKNRNSMFDNLIRLFCFSG